MKNELRLGNFITTDLKKDVFIVSGIDCLKGVAVSTIDNSTFTMPKGWKPIGIPITEEMLLKFPKNLTYPKWIKYLHELQNWYYWNNCKNEVCIKNV